MQLTQQPTAVSSSLITSCGQSPSSTLFLRLISMQKTRSHWSHREPRTISKWLLRMMIALVGLCLLQLLTGCGNTRTVYVPVPAVPLPANLTAETPQPAIPDPLTWSGSLDLNVSLLSALASCNRDKLDIRKSEHLRSEKNPAEK